MRQIQELQLSSIAPFRFQPRRQVSAASRAKIAASIRSHGVQQPILVRPNPDYQDLGQAGALPYELVDGQRRTLGCTDCGLRTIPAIVEALSDVEALEISLASNESEELNPIDLALSFRQLQALGRGVEDIAVRQGCSATVIYETLRLLELPDPVQQLVADGHLPASHAGALTALSDTPELCSQLALDCAGEGWSVRRLEKTIRRELNPPAPAKPKQAPGAGHLADFVSCVISQANFQWAATHGWTPDEALTALREQRAAGVAHQAIGSLDALLEADIEREPVTAGSYANGNGSYAQRVRRNPF